MILLEMIFANDDILHDFNDVNRVNDINDDSAVDLWGSKGEYNVSEISWKGGIM